MATCKIVRRNLAMKIHSAKDKMSLGMNKVSFQNKLQSTFLKCSKIGNENRIGLVNKGIKRKDTANNLNDQSHSEITFQSADKYPLPALRSFTNKACNENGKLPAKPTFTNSIKRVFGPPRTEESTDEEVLHRGAVATLAANRRLLKSSNGFKIFPARRFGSSASSSGCSVSRRHDDRNRAYRSYRHGLIERAFSAQSRPAVSDQITSSLPTPKYLRTRNQNMSGPLGSVSDAIQLSLSIQEDLMAIDKEIRERIALKNTNSAPPPQKIQNGDGNKNSLYGWDHPPPLTLITSRNAERLSLLGDQIKHVPTIRNPTTKAIRKNRLDVQCKLSKVPRPAPSFAPSVSLKKVPVSQQATPLDTDIAKESIRDVSNLTARRMGNLETQKSNRRVSQRRPPKVAESNSVTTAAGPAVEILQQKRKTIAPKLTVTTVAAVPNTPTATATSKIAPAPISSASVNISRTLSALPLIAPIRDSFRLNSGVY